MLKIIEIEGRTYSFSGSEGDGYFAILEQFYTATQGMVNWVAKNIKKDSVLLDVGANIGLTAIAMAHFLPDGVVYAFEPSPINIADLKNNIARNNVKNVRVIESAVGFTEGFVNFNLPASASNCTVLRGTPSGENFARVPITPLDTWWSSEGSPKVDFIKLDVEGFETDVLRGAANLITKCAPKM